MSEEAIYQRLRRLRIARGESLSSFAARHGMRVEFLRAIEEGRFQDLPTGIYARAAVRAHATALGLDPDEILATCGPLLPAVEDPIAAIGRLRGLPRRPRQMATEAENTMQSHRTGHTSDRAVLPSWRMAAASAIDAAAMAAMLLAVVTCTVGMGVPVSALGGAAAPAFCLMAAVLSGCYFILLGGIVGVTAGEYLTGARAQATEQRPLDLRAVAARTRESVFRDACFIELLGKWIGRLIADHGWPHRESLITNHQS